MAAVPPRPARRRPRRGSLERPLNSRLYPDAWLLVALPPLPPGFDGRAALELAQDLVRTNPDRSPGTLGSARWFREQLTPYGLRIHEDAFRATIPGRGRVTLRNLVAVVPGRSPQAIVVMAHRDDTGAGPGADDNGSGTAALVEIARSYSTPTAAGANARAPRVRPAHTLLFVSTDGGAFGGLGAAHFARESAARNG